MIAIHRYSCRLKKEHGFDFFFLITCQRNSRVRIKGVGFLNSHRTTLHHLCCSVLQCVAVCCSVLQCVAVCCSVLQRVGFLNFHRTTLHHLKCAWQFFVYIYIPHANHTHNHTHTQPHIQPHTQTHTHTHTCTHTSTRAHTHTHAGSHSLTHISMRS